MNSKEKSDYRSSTTAEQTRVLSGWVPVVKIFTTKNRAVRALWILFTVVMVIALVSSISVVVHKYLTNITVVRLDERGPQDAVSPPAVTICLAEHERNLSIEFNDPKPTSWNITTGKSKVCDVNYQLEWNSKFDAISPLYRPGGDFAVHLGTQPVVRYRLQVFEQVPAPPNHICTTFELSPVSAQNATFWKVFRVSIRLVDSKRGFSGRPLVIVHEKRSFPLDNFGRYFYEYLDPGTSKNIFWNKVITRHLDTRSKPCARKPVMLLGQQFDYDQVACQWQTICQYYHSRCNCLCPLDIVRRLATNHDLDLVESESPLHRTCPTRCQNSFPIALVNASLCPIACHYVTYTRLNDVLDTFGNSSAAEIVLIQAEGITEMIEEELYSLPKLFSEIGGLSSFCFGFSCILFFEVFEIILQAHKKHRTTNLLCEKLRSKPKMAGGIHGSGNLETSSQIRSCIQPVSYSCLFERERPQEILLHPLKVCRVDGSRFSDYSSPENSPLLSLKLRHCNNQYVHAVQCGAVKLSFGSCQFKVPLEVLDQRTR